MKKTSVALFVSLLALTFLACKKDGSTDPDQPGPNPSGEVTSVGTPDSDPIVRKIVGSAGGSVTSFDGRMKLVIPQGALSSDKEISIKTISNQNPLGLQQAYRIEPHGVQFAKPVSIQVSYDDDDLKRTIPEALGIAYQDSKGVWQARGGTELDKVNHRITTITDHFSDWSLFESVYLMVEQPVIPVSAATKLEVFSTEDLLIPLDSGKDIAIGKKQTMAAKYVKEWTLAGAGNLTSNGSNAMYKAPAAIPARNPVAVSVRLDLKQRGVFLLVKNITIQPDDGEIEVRVNGGEWFRQATSAATKLAANYYSIADSDGDDVGRFVLLTWQGGVGTHAYKSPFSTAGTHAQYHITGVDNYTCILAQPDGPVASGGGVTITSMGETDGFVKGSFSINPAGCGPNLLGRAVVEGKFRVRKNF
ncbi:hypothetical protein LZZ85_15760 [Terrimonas sp. NA20]|uniref:ZU5 domain-containing protein n=1 Tax=Terrimonas ginsenosidimutans TaxID=2908004 RepID=A0ABS9KTU7_9BACT|nr:hypothetical protein [Terrimonas ginsenosidimutans]MCG2615756.1 hypothetical protein [Terrimonas ginsenosidimutans]